MPPVLICIPNVSEGRRITLIDNLAAAIQSVEEVRLLDTHSDPDHNRSVFTFAGPPESVKRAAYVLTEAALATIDISKHYGVHPKIGAIDVIPFVPWKDMTMAEAVSHAHELGKDIAEKLEVPVYFYEQAARLESRRSLSSLRRGGLDKLKEIIQTADGAPDAGPGSVHPRAGAVVVGARGPLIAFNVNLVTNQLEIAQQIATKIRERDGGFPGVRALGVPLESRKITQVTVNITDYQKAPLKDVVAAVFAEAEALRVPVLESELVGMIPKAATFEGMKKALKISNFTLSKILENALLS
jgi:glutamate formiminotransferase